jgi:hypothetical protein
MEHSPMLKQLTYRSLIVTLLLTGAPINTALGGVISTQQAVRLEWRQDHIARINTVLARDDVHQMLIRYGVDPDIAAKRVAALTNTELAMIESRIEQMPAGAGVIEVVGIVAVVLLILELLGVTNVFTKF